MHDVSIKLTSRREKEGWQQESLMRSYDLFSRVQVTASFPEHNRTYLD